MFRVVVVGVLVLAGGSAEARLPEVSAHAVVVTNVASGEVLFERNADEQRSIASLSKVVAAVVVRQRGLDVSSKAATTINRDDWRVALGGARTRLQLNWTYRNIDLLRAALMSSDNRAVSALGRAVGLDAVGLVRAMNAFAREHGLRRTRFEDPVGIDPGNVSSARDVCRAMQLANEDKVLRAVMSTPEYRVKPVRGYLALTYRNTNPLVGDGRAAITASKTGYNTKAGYCIAVVARVRRVGLVSVALLGSRSKAGRVEDLRRVLRWVRRNARKGPREPQIQVAPVEPLAHVEANSKL